MSQPQTQPLKITPMLQQYLEIKSQYPDTILFYRLGDFYEMFFEDAVTASRVLGITLTSRNHKDEESKIPLCGVPHHAASSYLAKLVRAGFRVAICEQVEDPRLAKGVVKREVVRVVTPGLVTDALMLDDKSNRYVAAICQTESTWGLSLLDLTTGEFLVTEQPESAGLADELTRMAPAEVVIEDDAQDPPALLAQALTTICLTRRPATDFYPETARAALLDHFKTVNLAGFGCDSMTAGIAAAGALLLYIRETQKSELNHVEQLTPFDLADLLVIDDASRRNLELTQTIIGANREGSLLATLDATRTPMGARLLKKNLLFPLQDVNRIKARLATVDLLFHDAPLREAIRDILSQVYDLERLNSRVVLGSANARDLTALKVSLGRLPELKAILSNRNALLAILHDELDTLADIHSLLTTAIREDAPVTLRDGGLIRDGFHAELDELLLLLKDGKSLILALEIKEREKSGINNLKVGYNKIFGYYFEISRGQLGNVPEHFIRKQTLVNAERFITEELKEFETKVTGAEERRLELEYQLFCEIRSQVAGMSTRILETASAIARLDFFASLAETARRNRYIRPQVDNGEEIKISEGRHPVIELSLPPGRFVPNDITLNQTSDEVLIVTGPNMAGKSTVLRQTALIVLMAQMGSFVPAAEAKIGVVDRIFTRVGAMDDLRRGQSTFMVEMNETANILNNATEKSLVILDEIGRGTSTFDGLAIAWAVAEELVNRNGRGVKTIFATHYHELTELASTSERIKNFNIAVREWNDSIIFLHKLIPGGANRSYGIQVAALAGVPGRVVSRAKEILANIEKGEFNHTGEPRIAPTKKSKSKAHPNQLSIFSLQNDPIRKKVAELQLDRLTPLEALTILYELKELDRQESK